MLCFHCDQVSCKFGIAHFWDASSKHVVIKVERLHFLHLHQGRRNATIEVIMGNIQHPQFTVVFLVDIAWDLTFKLIV